MNFPPISNEVVINSYLAHKTPQWRLSTVQIRTIQLRRIAEQLSPATLIDVTEETILAWYDRFPGLPETRASYASAAHGLYRWMTVYARPRLQQ